jgi:hypothetical protein
LKTGQIHWLKTRKYFRKKKLKKSPENDFFLALFYCAKILYNGGNININRFFMKKYFLSLFFLGFLVFSISHSFATERSDNVFWSKVKLTSEASNYLDSQNISVGDRLRFLSFPSFLNFSGDVFLSNTDFTCSGTGVDEVCVTDSFTGQKSITNTLTGGGQTLTGYTTVNSGTVPVRLKIYKGYLDTYDVFKYEGGSFSNLNKSEFFSAGGINLGTNNSSRQIYMEAVVECASGFVESQGQCLPANEHIVAADDGTADKPVVISSTASIIEVLNNDRFVVPGTQATEPVIPAVFNTNTCFTTLVDPTNGNIRIADFEGCAKNQEYTFTYTLQKNRAGENGGNWVAWCDENDSSYISNNASVYQQNNVCGYQKDGSDNYYPKYHGEILTVDDNLKYDQVGENCQVSASYFSSCLPEKNPATATVTIMFEEDAPCGTADGYDHYYGSLNKCVKQDTVDEMWFFYSLEGSAEIDKNSCRYNGPQKPIDTDYHVEGDDVSTAYCEKNTRACTQEYLPENSTGGTQTWESTTNEWGACENFTCADGYEPSADGKMCLEDPVCGADSGTDKYFLTAPVNNLCAVGTASSVALNGDKWEWSCVGAAQETSYREIDCSANMQYEVDLVMVDKENFSTDIANPNEIDAGDTFSPQLAIGVDGCYDTGNFRALTGANACDNSQYLAGKRVKFSFEWDKDKFEFTPPPGSTEFSSAQKILYWKNNKFTTLRSSTICTLQDSLERIVCYQDSHGEVDKGIGNYYNILKKIKFTHKQDQIFSGNSFITFKTWTEDLSIVDEGYGSGVFSDPSNNVLIFPIRLLDPEVSVANYEALYEYDGNNYSTSTVESNGFDANISDGIIALYPRITNSGGGKAKNLRLEVEFNSDVLTEYDSVVPNNWEVTRDATTNPVRIIFTQVGGDIPGNSSEDFIVYFTPRVLSSSTDPLVVYNIYDKHDTLISSFDVFGNISPVSIAFDGGTTAINLNENTSLTSPSLLAWNTRPDPVTQVYPTRYYAYDGSCLGSLVSSNSGNFVVMNDKLATKAGKTFDYETDNHVQQVCVQAQSGGTVWGEQTFTVHIKNVNEEPTSDTNIDTEIDVPFEASNPAGITKTLEELGVNDATDVDADDTLSNLQISGISATYTPGSTAWTSSGTLNFSGYKGNLEIINNSVKYIPDAGVYHETSDNADVFYYKFCDDDLTTPLCGVRKIAFRISSGGQCSHPFDTAITPIAHTQSNPEPWYATDNNLLCEPTAFTCFDEKWKNDELSLEYEHSEIASNYSNSCTTEVNPILTDTSGFEEEILYVGRILPFKPNVSSGIATFPENSGITGTLTARYNPNVFEYAGAGEGWICDAAIGVCTKENTSFDTNYPLTLKVIGNVSNAVGVSSADLPENISYSFAVDTATTSGYPNINIANPADVSPAVTLRQRHLLETSFPVSGDVSIENIADTNIDTLEVYSGDSVSGFSLSLDDTGDICSDAENDYFDLNGFDVTIGQKFNTATKTACVKISDSDHTLGYATVEVTVEATGCNTLQVNDAGSTTALTLDDFTTTPIKYFEVQNWHGEAAQQPTSRNITCESGSYYWLDDDKKLFINTAQVSTVYTATHKQCVDPYLVGSYVNHGDERVAYSQATFTGDQLCANNQQMLTCEEGVWKNGGVAFTYDSSVNNWTNTAEDVNLYRVCTDVSLSCDLSLDDGEGVISIPQGKTFGVLNAEGVLKLSEGVVVPENFYKSLYESPENTADASCKEQILNPSAIYCDPDIEEVLYGTVSERTNGEAERLYDAFSTCDQSCELEGVTYYVGDTQPVTKSSANTCEEDILVCQSSGLWENGAGEEGNGYGYSTAACESEGVTEEVVDEVEEIVDVSTPDDPDSEETGKTVDTPLANIDGKAANMTDLDTDIYRETSEDGEDLFVSPWSGAFDASSLKVRLSVRAYLEEDESMFTRDEDSDLNSNEKIVVRWKVAGKDKYGDAISLSSSFNYIEDTSSDEYGCADTMMCEDDFIEKNNQIEEDDEGRRFVELAIENDGFIGKAQSVSTRENIQNAIKDLYGDEQKVSLNQFLTNADLGVSYPEFQIMYESPLGGNSEYSNLAYKLEIDGVSDGAYALSDNRFVVTAIGRYKGIEQRIETIIEKGQILPVFNYVIFGE